MNFRNVGEEHKMDHEKLLPQKLNLVLPDLTCVVQRVRKDEFPSHDKFWASDMRKVELIFKNAIKTGGTSIVLKFVEVSGRYEWLM